jgi:hypothetical protein
LKHIGRVWTSKHRQQRPVKALESGLLTG